MDENVDVSPAIIVQGGWFSLNTNPDIYKEVTERAARVGYGALMVSVVGKHRKFIDRG